MVNCNPETVSTDYDTSDRLYFEPLTVEDVMAVIEAEKPARGHRPARWPDPAQHGSGLDRAGVPIAGTSPDAIDAAEDRERFAALCVANGVPQPPNGIATSVAEALDVIDRIGLPALVRPSYVLGGRAMRIIYSVDELSEYLSELSGGRSAGEVGAGAVGLRDAPLLIDRFLESAVEVDVDAVYDGAELYIGGVMEHVEEAGVHSGDSACVVPPPNLAAKTLATITEYTERLARGIGVRGLLNIQFAVRDDDGVRARGQPTGVPDRAVHLQGHGSSAGEGGNPSDDGGEPRRFA